MSFYSHAEEVRLAIEECEGELVSQLVRTPTRMKFVRDLVKYLELERVVVLETGNMDRMKGLQEAITKIKAVAKKAEVK